MNLKEINGTNEELKQSFIDKLLSLDNGLVNIHFQAGEVQTVTSFCGCHTKADVLELEYDEDDQPDEPDTYVEYTIIGETLDKNYQNTFRFIDFYIHEVRHFCMTEPNSDVLQADIFNIKLFDGESQRHSAMFVFPVATIVSMPTSMFNF